MALNNSSRPLPVWVADVSAREHVNDGRAKCNENSIFGSRGDRLMKVPRELLKPRFVILVSGGLIDERFEVSDVVRSCHACRLASSHGLDCGLPTKDLRLAYAYKRQ